MNHIKTKHGVIYVKESSGIPRTKYIIHLETIVSILVNTDVSWITNMEFELKYT